MNRKIFATNLQKLLAIKQIKPIELHRRSGLSKTYIHFVLKGAQANLSLGSLYKIADALGITHDDVHRLYLSDFDVEKHFGPEGKKKASIIVPYLPDLSQITKEYISRLNSHPVPIRRDTLASADSKPYISFPVVNPFNVMEKQKMICFCCDIEVGMRPAIEPMDIVTVDLSCKHPRETLIYLVFLNKHLTLRYASLLTIREETFIRLWTEERRFQETVIPLPESGSPILGQVTTVTRRFSSSPSP